MTSPLNSALDQAQERKLEQEVADVPVEDRVGDARGRRERDAVDPQQRRSPMPRETEPAMISAMNNATPPSTQPARGVRSGRSPASNTMACSFASLDRNRSRPPKAEPPPRRSSAALAASLRRSNSERSDPDPLPMAAGRDGRRARDCRRGRSGRGRTPRAPRPKMATNRAQNTESKPTLSYHSASVHRSSPRLNNRKTAMAMAMKAATPNRRPTRAARLPAPSLGPPGPRVRPRPPPPPPRRRRGSMDLGRSASSSAGSVLSDRRPRPRRHPRGLRRARRAWLLWRRSLVPAPASSSGWSAPSSDGGFARRLRGVTVSGSSPRATASRLRSSSMKSSNRSRIGDESTRVVRSGPVEALDGLPEPR